MFYCFCWYTAWLLGVIVAGWCVVQSWFVDFVRGKLAGTIVCLLSFVHFTKPGLSATSRVLVIWRRFASTCDVFNKFYVPSPRKQWLTVYCGFQICHATKSFHRLCAAPMITTDMALALDLSLVPAGCDSCPSCNSDRRTEERCLGKACWHR